MDTHVSLMAILPGEPGLASFRLTLSVYTYSYYKGNSAGLAMYFICPPTDFLVTYSVDSSCLAALSCGTWTTSVVSWISEISLLSNWNSFQPTETHGKMHVPMAWQHTTWLQIKQLRNDLPVGTIHPTHQLLVRDVHSAAESVLPSSACAAIRSHASRPLQQHS